MSTKGTIYYDHNTEAFDDSTDQSVNLCADKSSLIRVEFNQGFLFIEWESSSMPRKLKFDSGDIKAINIDNDGLLVVFDYNSKTGKSIYGKNIEHFSIE